MIFSIKEIIYSIVDAAIIIYFFTRFIGSTEKLNFKIAMYTVFTGLIVQLMTPLVGVMIFLKMLITIITLMIVLKINYKEVSFLKSLMFIGGSIFVLLISEVIVGTIIYIVTGISPQVLFQNTIYRDLGAILSKGIWCVLLNFLVLKFNEKYNIKKKQTYFINLIIIANVMYLTFIIWMNTLIDISVSTQKHVVIAVTISVLFMSLGIIGLFNRILKQNEMELEWKLKEDMYDQQYKYLEEISDVNLKLRSQRHDFTNHLNSLQGLAYLGKDEELKNYLNALIGDVEDLNKSLYTSNPILNGFLSLKKKEAESIGASFEIEVMYPEKTHIRENDIVALLGNLIDNAIEASKETEEKLLILKVKYKNGRGVISIKNSRDPSIDLKNIGKNGFTTKSDKQQHGFGIYNVKNIVNEYGGMYDFLDLNNMFEVRIMI